MTRAATQTSFHSALGAANHAHHRGGHIVGPILLLIIITVVVILIVQRRRDRKLPEVAVPPLNLTTTSDAVDAPPSASSVNTISHVETAAPPREPRTMPPGHYGITGLLRSEWTKLRTVRSTMWTLGATIVLGIGLSVLLCAITRAQWSNMSVENRLTFDPTSLSLVGILVGEFAIGILGVLIMSAEYGTGTIRSTFAGAPRRSQVLAAKAIVFGFTTLVIAEVVAFLSFFIGQALLTAPAVHTTLSSPGALTSVVGSGVFLCLLGLLALGLATIIRHTAGAVSTYIGILLLLPIIVAVLPSSISMDMRRYLPDHIGAAVITLHPGPNFFSPWIGLIVLAGYAAVALIIGAVLLVRRDA